MLEPKRALRAAILCFAVAALMAVASLYAANTKPLGYFRYAPNTSTVVKLSDAPAAGITLPADAVGAQICAVTVSFNYRTDGTNPSSTEGITLAPGQCVEADYESRWLRAIRLIPLANGGELRGEYYGD